MVIFPGTSMRKFKSNIWLTKPWILGLLIIIPLATAAIYTIWVLSDRGSIRNALPIILTASILCTAGAMLLIYVSRLPSVIKELVDESNTSSTNSGQRD